MRLDFHSYSDLDKEQAIEQVQRCKYLDTIIYNQLTFKDNTTAV